MEKITSKANQKVVDAAKLKGKPSEKEFLVEGFHLVNEAISLGLAKTIFSTKEIDSKGVASYLVTPEIIDKLAYAKTPEGIVAICSKKQSKDIVDINCCPNLLPEIKSEQEH